MGVQIFFLAMGVLQLLRKQYQIEITVLQIILQIHVQYSLYLHENCLYNPAEACYASGVSGYQLFNMSNIWYYLVFNMLISSF